MRSPLPSINVDRFQEPRESALGLLRRLDWRLRNSMPRRHVWFSIAASLGLSAAPSRAETDGAKLLGPESCVDCHAGPVEAWKRSAHARRSLDTLTTSLRGQQYMTRLGASGQDPLNHSTCVKCHGSLHPSKNDEFATEIGGVSCESCHGAAGESKDSPGWYDLHTGEWPDPDDQSLEEALETAGMGGTRNLYRLAIRCYDCHIVSDESVVEAGHVTGTHAFELNAWFQGEVRHNFAPYTIDADEDINANASNFWLAQHTEAKPRARQRMMFAVGQLADLEVSLRNRANAKTNGTFAIALASRALAALQRLREIAKRLDDKDLEGALEKIQVAVPLLTKHHNVDDADTLVKAANCMNQAAYRFIAKHDGDELAKLEPLIADSMKGKPYSKAKVEPDK